MSATESSSPAPYAVVTGGSSGIGFELARQFSSNGFDVLIAAEGGEVVEAAERVDGPGRVEALQVDLTRRDGVERLWSHITSAGRPVDAIALNAGVGNAGAFVETSLDDDLDLIALNITSVVHLAKLAIADMVARGDGKVLLTSSVASTMPGPYYATYAASKAFVQSFAEAVRNEVADTGVTVTALMPGPTDTDFFDRAGMQGSKADEGHKDDPADVARDGFEALMAGKDHVVAGSKRNKLQSAMGKVLPQKATAVVHGSMAKPGDASSDGGDDRG
ncbi:MAG: SDR family NAD(P)-dependent oxidoreductase [Ilumatobacteraceae bacterium]